MLKKTVGAAVATAGVLTMTAGPAMAGHIDAESNDWNGSINLVDANQVQIPVCLAQNNVGALIGFAVPILSPMFMGTCAESTAVMTDDMHLHKGHKKHHRR
ncbi:hypothetical protein GCM10012275_44140 [Longimycelium tulufanense]|uniref:Uncharacterized protein n=1 Tax=Longimycelium tulufanense TaxID=907463 RepID=A0A8J3CB86_9PSEU|nr:hypothetical protein [Longimycelium tulufanense]GGM68849.1 hypothetical protein GCM10012275_44140 [Longimycelium tulufanense]